jgi:hypothetical protein
MFSNLMDFPLWGGPIGKSFVHRPPSWQWKLPSRAIWPGLLAAFRCLRCNDFFFRFVYCVRYRLANAHQKPSFNILHARTRLVLYDDGAEKLRFLPEPSLCITHDLERSRTWQSPGAFGLLPDVETRVLLFGCGLLEGPSSRTWPSQKGRLTNLTFP